MASCGPWDGMTLAQVTPAARLLPRAGLGRTEHWKERGEDRGQRTVRGGQDLLPTGPWPRAGRPAPPPASRAENCPPEPGVIAVACGSSFWNGSWWFGAIGAHLPGFKSWVRCFQVYRLREPTSPHSFLHVDNRRCLCPPQRAAQRRVEGAQ